MQLRIFLLPVLASGCLARDISNQIDKLQCSAGGTASGTGTDSSGAPPEGTTDCPSTGGVQTSTESTASATDTSDGTSTGEVSGTDSESADATGDSSTDASSSTGEPVPECGNGVIEKLGPEPEDCDDGNDIPDDGCSNCGRDRLVFVTSADYQGSVFNGLGGADQRCRSLADQQDLPNYATYKAWLSDSKTSATDRMFHGRGRYELLNGLVVADSWDALLAGELQNPINVTETSETKNYQVWTGTLPDGNAALGADQCADWTGMLGVNTAFWGRSGSATSEWTIAKPPFDQPGDCGGERALYCFEQK